MYVDFEELSKQKKENTYTLNIKHDEVLKSKTLVRKIEKAIRTRRNYANKIHNREKK